MNIAIISINIYIVFTLLFFIVKHYKIDDNQTKPDINWIIYYFILSFFIMLIQNTYYSSLNDGETKCIIQPMTLFIYTIIPLCLIMGPIIILLVKMNWNRIFANTFGLLLAPKIILNNVNNEVLFFYNDPNILLQELEPDILFDKNKLHQELHKLLGQNINISDEEFLKIKDQYNIKQNVGYFIWMVLTGIITSLVSANSILIQDCIIE